MKFSLQITVTVEQLPELGSGESYECNFDLNDVFLTSPASKSGNDLTCTTPSTDLLPPIPEGEGKQPTRANRSTN